MKYIYLFFLLLIICACENEKVDPFNEDGSLKDVTLKITSAEDLVKKWTNAINERRWDVLNGLYADKVYYYSKKRSKKQCVERKIKSVEKDKSFTQEVGWIEIVDTYYNTKEIFFRKYYSNKGKQDSITAILSIVKDEKRGWVITQESDVVTSKNKGNLICSCSDFWVAMYNGGGLSYYRLSETWGDNGLMYISKDGDYYLEIAFLDEDKIVFVPREDRGTHAARLGDWNEFSVKKEEMKIYYGVDDKGVKEKFDRRLFKRLNEFCK